MHGATLSPEAQADALLQHYLSSTEESDQTWTEEYAAGMRDCRDSAHHGQLFMDRLLSAAGVNRVYTILTCSLAISTILAK